MLLRRAALLCCLAATIVLGQRAKYNHYRKDYHIIEHAVDLGTITFDKASNYTTVLLLPCRMHIIDKAFNQFRRLSIAITNCNLFTKLYQCILFIFSAFCPNSFQQLAEFYQLAVPLESCDAMFTEVPYIYRCVEAK